MLPKCDQKLAHIRQTSSIEHLHEATVTASCVTGQARLMRPAGAYVLRDINFVDRA